MKKKGSPKPHTSRRRQMADHHYFTIFNRTPISTQIFSSDGTTIAVNKAWEKLWGIKGEKVVGIYNILQDRQLVEKKVMPHIKKAFKGEAAKIPAIRYEPRKTVGDIGAVTYRILGASVYPIKDEGGKVQEVVLVHEDITTQVAYEEGIKESEQRFRTFADFAPVGIFQTDPDGNCLFVNKRWSEIAGMTINEARGDGWGNGLHPGDRDRIFKKWYDAAKSKKEFSAIYRFLRPDGKVTWVKGNAIGLYNNKKLTGYLGAVVDITRQKEIEERLQQYANIVEFSDDAIVSKNIDGFITSWNKGAERLFGYSAKEIVGKPVSVLMPPNKKSDFPRIMKKLQKGETVDHYETMRQTKDGRIIDVSITVSPIQDEMGKVVGASKIARDITQRKMVERQKDEFIAIASHELKTPVTSLKVYAQALHRRFEREGNMVSAVNLEKMNLQIDKLTGLVAELLDVTKIQAGKIMLNETNFDYDTLLHEIIEDMQRTTDQHTILLKGKVGKIIFGDRDRIGQILINLISNAIKYSPGADKILVGVETDGKKVTTCVKDYGVGIKVSNKERVFERFFRASGPKQETFPGLGLGLYITREIVKRQGGKIWVKSTLGKGSTFCFSIPIRTSPK